VSKNTLALIRVAVVALLSGMSSTHLANASKKINNRVLPDFDFGKGPTKSAHHVKQGSSIRRDNICPAGFEHTFLHLDTSLANSTSKRPVGSSFVCQGVLPLVHRGTLPVLVSGGVEIRTASMARNRRRLVWSLDDVLIGEIRELLRAS